MKPDLSKNYGRISVICSLDIGIRDLPFDSFDLEALDRLAQGGELVEPFGICFSY
jgi:hypothetical protein